MNFLMNYILLCRQDDIVIGGTAQEGRWDRRPDPVDAKVIWERALGVFPSLKVSPILCRI